MFFLADSDPEFLLKSSPDQNHNSLLTISHQEDSSDAAMRLEKELLAARLELETTQALMEEIRLMRTSNNNNTRDTGQDISSNNINNNSCDSSLTQQQVDQLLDRFDGFVPQVSVRHFKI